MNPAWDEYQDADGNVVAIDPATGVIGIMADAATGLPVLMKEHLNAANNYEYVSAADGTTVIIDDTGAPAAGYINWSEPGVAPYQFTAQSATSPAIVDVVWDVAINNKMNGVTDATGNMFGVLSSRYYSIDPEFNFVIPSTVMDANKNVYPVVAIADYAFAEKRTDGTYMENWWFQGDLVIPEGITSIGNSAFYNCYCLNAVRITLANTLSGSLAVTLPASLKSVGDYAFYGCTNLATNNTIKQAMIDANPTMNPNEVNWKYAHFYIQSDSIKLGLRSFDWDRDDNQNMPKNLTFMTSSRANTDVKNYVDAYKANSYRWSFLDTLFMDVELKDYFHNAALKAVNYRYMTGKGQEKQSDGVTLIVFDPAANITRYEVAQIIYKCATNRINNSLKAATPQKPSDPWYTEAVEWVKKNGIMTGKPGNDFAGNDTITRAEFAQAIFKYAEAAGNLGGAYVGNDNHKVSLEVFADKEKIALWSEQALGWAVYNKVMSGKPEKALAPQDTITRGEVAVMMDKLAGLARL